MKLATSLESLLAAPAPAAPAPAAPAPAPPFAGPSAITLDAQQLATVRAAVEWYFQSGFGDHAHRPADLHDLATASGACSSLDDAGLVNLQVLLDDARTVSVKRAKAA